MPTLSGCRWGSKASVEGERKKEGQGGRRAFKPAPAPEGEEIAFPLFGSASALRGRPQPPFHPLSFKDPPALCRPFAVRPPGACFPWIPRSVPGASRFVQVFVFSGL